MAIVTVTEEGTLEYRLVAANLQNVTAAHIHRSGTGGGVAFLYDAISPADVHDKVVLASGTITAADLMEPTLTVEQLAGELLGGTPFYVNVHTTERPPFAHIRNSTQPQGNPQGPGVLSIRHDSSDSIHAAAQR